MVWKERNDRFFKDVEQIDQMLKFSFLCLFLEWVRVGLDEVTMSMVDLADYFFISCFFCFDLAFWCPYMRLENSSVLFLQALLIYLFLLS